MLERILVYTPCLMFLACRTCSLKEWKRVWLALGSNLGDSEQILQQAWLDLGLSNAVETIRISSPYVTEPVGMESEHLFFNAVGILSCSLDALQLLALLQQIEKGFGRSKKTGVEGYQDRLLDLDILYFGDSILNSKSLVLPHPHIAERLFVLAPLAEIDSKHCDPVTGLTAERMHRDLLQQMTSGITEVQDIKRHVWA